MDFLGIGPMELFFIIVIILLVFGPHRLPEVGRTVAKAVRDIKSATWDLSRSLTAEMEEEERRMKTPSLPPAREELQERNKEEDKAGLPEK